MNRDTQITYLSMLDKAITIVNARGGAKLEEKAYAKEVNKWHIQLFNAWKSWCTPKEVETKVETKVNLAKELK